MKSIRAAYRSRLWRPNRLRARQTHRSSSSFCNFCLLKDLTPVATAGGGVFLLVVAPSVPAKTVKELVDHARANPGKINFGFGQGTLPHMLGASLKVSTGIDLNLVPYKGGAQALADMLGGHIQMNFGTTATLLALIRQGKLRPLAVTNGTRLAELPDTPTMAESGFPNLTLRYWMAVWAPPRTPAAIVEKLNGAVNEILKSKDAQAGLARLSAEAKIGSPQDFAAFIGAEAPRWAAIANETGIKVD
jgi:tripartite-type tricarboxylate transporter receptor subunit TctC